MEKVETYIGRLAIQKQFITEEQLRECLAIQESLPEAKDIGDLLVEKGYLSQDNLDRLQRKRMLNIKKLESQAVYDYLTKMKMVPPDRLKKALETQQGAQEQKTYIPLADVLVSHGLWDRKKADEVVQSKEVVRFIRQAICADDPRRTGLEGRVLGGYEIRKTIASGGMGTVYKALQLELGRTVALKILFDRFASVKKHLAQFFTEARLAGRLNHPNLVHIFDVGEDQGFFYYSMELVEGVNLGDRLGQEKKLPQGESLDIIIQCAKGLHHIHGFNIVHRDIKPSNFIVRNDGIVKIMDLGLARQLDKQQKQSPATMGTPYYMSPELILDPIKADHRADIYALGASFYRMITGEYPITGKDAREILKNITEQTPKRVTELDPEIHVEIAQVIEKMLEKDVEKRYQNMGDVLNDLDRILI